MAYDIIGDIHGQAEKLEALLRKLGYSNTGGAWRHPARQAFFVGDIVDGCGAEQLRSVETVRRMVDTGTALAVMGNHELNAIAWHTRDGKRLEEYLRPHNGEYGPGNRKQHAAFLAEVEAKPALHAEIIEWFLSLPLWLELAGLRVVHACWHAPFMTWLSPQLHERRYLTRELMVPATDEPTDKAEKDNATPSIFKAVEALTKGIEIPLPAGHQFYDKFGNVKHRVRVRWWDGGATTYRSAAMLSPAECAALPDLPIPGHARLGRVTERTLFGHYWLTGVPAVQSKMAVCVDYSAGKGGALVAYRFDGEPDLSSERFVWVA